MKLIVLCLTLMMSVGAQSKYLQDKEEYQLKKGAVFNIRYQKTIYVLSFNIWANEYLLVKKDEKQTFNHIDDVFIYLKDEKKFPYVYLKEVEKDAKESDIFLVNIINDFFKTLIFRKINLNEIYK